MSKWPTQAAAKEFYGNNIRVVKGVAGPDPKFERDNLVLVPIPWSAVASWDHSFKIKSLRVHRRCAESLTRVLDRIWNEFGQDQAAIEKVRLHLVGGGYNWRAMRGSSRISMHSYGCAIDLDPDHNAMGNAHPAMDPRVVAAFKSEGWTWGGDWSPGSRDGMHFQAASV